MDINHRNEGIRIFAPELQGRLISALEYKYDRHLVDTILDTAESMLVEELDTPVNRENISSLRSYINRRWEDIKPFNKRELPVNKAIGSCESNHRKYTYRVKGQGKYWSKGGAEGMLRILSCVKNDELDYWFESSHLNAKNEKELKQQLEIV